MSMTTALSNSVRTRKLFYEDVINVKGTPDLKSALLAISKMLTALLEWSHPQRSDVRGDITSIAEPNLGPKVVKPLVDLTEQRSCRTRLYEYERAKD